VVGVVRWREGGHTRRVHGPRPDEKRIPFRTLLEVGGEPRGIGIRQAVPLRHERAHRVVVEVSEGNALSPCITRQLGQEGVEGMAAGSSSER